MAKGSPQRHSPSGPVNLQRFEYGFLGLADMSDIGNRYPFDKNRRLQGIQSFTHMQRKPGFMLVAAVGRGRGLFADQGGGSHLPTGHPINPYC